MTSETYFKYIELLGVVPSMSKRIVSRNVMFVLFSQNGF